LAAGRGNARKSSAFRLTWYAHADTYRPLSAGGEDHLVGTASRKRAKYLSQKLFS
jgi:hypothetical protein